MTKAQQRKWIANGEKMGHQEHALGYAAEATARKPHAGYSVRKVAAGWTILFGGVALYPPSDTRTAYGWICRTALDTLRDEADTLRSYSPT